MEDIIKGIIYALGFLYKILELIMPFMIWHIYNKVDEIERKLKK